MADFYNNRIQVFEPDGTYLTQWAKDPSLNPPLKGPTGLAIDDEGNSYVVDFHHHRILKFLYTYIR